MTQNKKQKNRSILNIKLFRFLKKLKWIRNKVPIMSCVLFFLISIIPVNNHFLTQKPPLFFLPFFYWMTSKSSLNIGLMYILIISFVYDILDNNVFGINMFLIIIMYYFLVYQKLISINKNYITHYMTFITIMFFYYISKYLMYSYMFDVNPNIVHVIINYIIIVMLYPVTYVIMKKIDKYIVQ